MTTPLSRSEWRIPRDARPRQFGRCQTCGWKLEPEEQVVTVFDGQTSLTHHARCLGARASKERA